MIQIIVAYSIIMMLKTYFMKYLSLSFFILFLTFSPIVFSSTVCENTFSSASLAFIDYARKHLGRNWQKKMDADWEKQIKEHATNWTYENAIEFLNFLENHMGREMLIEKMNNNLLHVAMIKLEDLEPAVKFMEKYLTKEEIIQNIL